MGNPAKGEVSFEAAGKRWLLKFGTNALATVEREFDIRLREFPTRFAEPSVGDIITLFAIALRQHSPEVTDAQAGDLIDDIGFDRANELLFEALTLAFPAAAQAGEGPAETTKKKTRRTGSRS